MALVDDIKKLAAIPALRDLEPEALRKLAFSADTRVFRTGDVLFRRGEMSDCGYALLGGAVALETVPGAPRSIVRAPALIGETALIVDTQWGSRASVAEPSIILRIPRALFLRVVAEHPRTANALRLSTEQKLRALQGELLELAQGALAA